ncbi:MAG: hypothetical protein J6C96_09130 [Oscillospiraceae bacterium]|nr:hypothetical protein [Oscillospiraceae bacterium]
MKLHILCEKCGCDNYKSRTNPIQFKYHSTYHVPIFECAECGQKYGIAATLKSFIFEQCCMLIPSLICGVLFMLSVPFSAKNVLAAFMCFMLIYGSILFVWNIIQSYCSFRPISFVIIPVDDELTIISNDNEVAHFCAETTSLTKLAKKLKPRTVYKCKAGSAAGAVKLLEFDVTDSGLTFMLKNISIGEKVFDGSEFVLTDAKGREVCRGIINKN